MHIFAATRQVKKISVKTQKRHSRLSPLLAISAALALCALLAPFIFAYGFIFPQGDDFDEATRAVCLFDFIGGLYEVGREWFSWSGRYTYHFMAVFFGKAAESRFWSGAVCFGVLCSYAFAFWWLLSPFVRQRFYSRLHRLVFSLASLLALYVCHGMLPNFYLLTDALSSAHQGATALLFLALIISLWQKVDTDSSHCKKEWRHTLLTGIFAIGVYEHAALAVICISLTAVCLALFMRKLEHLPKLAGWHLALDRKMEGKWTKKINHWLGKLASPSIKPFFTLFICLLFPLAISFLAPGNFTRNMKRGVDFAIQLSNIKNVCHDWLNAMVNFFESPWIPVSICLVVGMRFFIRPPDVKIRNFSRFAAIAAILCFLLFSFSLVFLQALSDVPFSSQPKLEASFSFYAAITFTVLLFHILSSLSLPEKLPRLARSLLALLCVAIFCCLAISTRNFRSTLINAANGNFSVLAEEMSIRDLWFDELRAEKRIQAEPTGLLGEILFPGCRARKPRPNLSQAAVNRIPQSVFPVYMHDALSPDCESWPNLWAAWFYCQGCVYASAPSQRAALAKIRNGEGLKLELPEALLNAGIEEAWRINAHGGIGPTFALSWLVLKLAPRLAGSLTVLRANPISSARLMPIAAQEKWQAGLYKKNKFFLDFQTRLTAASLTFPLHSGKNEFVALPLGNAQIFSALSLAPLFLSINESEFYRLASPKNYTEQSREERL